MFAPLLRLTAAGLLLATLARPAAAQQPDTFWVAPGGTGNWFTASNWSGPVPNADGIWAQFGQSGTGTPTVTLDGPATLGRLTTRSSFNFTVAGGNTLTLSPTVNIPTIDAVTSGNFNIQTPVSLNATLLRLANSGFAASGAMSQGVLTVGSLTAPLPNTTVQINPTDITVAPSVVALESAAFSGTLQLSGGVFRAADGVGVPTTANFQNTGGYWDQPAAGTVTRGVGTGPGQMQLSGTAVGFGGFNGPVTFNFGNGATVVWGAAGFTPGRVQFGRGVTAGGNDSYTWQNPIDLNGATRTVVVGIGSGVQATLRLTGPVTGGAAAGLTLNASGGFGGAVELAGTNTYGGPTTVSGTFLRAVDGVGLSPNSVLVVQGGGVEGGAVGSPTFDRPLGSGPGQVRLPGGQAFFAALGSPFTVQVGGGAAPTPLVWGSADFNPAGLTLGFTRSDALTDFRNPIDLNVSATSAVRFLEVRNNLTSTTDVGRFSGVISNTGATGPTVALAINGNGFVEFAAANTYNIQTAVTSPLAGAGLRLVGGGSFANSPAVILDTGETLDVSAVTSGANFSVAANRFLLAPGQTLAGTGTVTGPVLVGPGATITGGTNIFGTAGQQTGQLTVAGPLRLVGSGFGPSAALRVDLTGVTASGATVSRVAVTGEGNTFDLAATAGPGGSPVVVRLANDGGLVVGQTYSFIVASATGGFTRDGNAVLGAYNFGTDFVLESGTFPAFTNVSLTPSGANLILAFTPVPEPGLGVAAGVAGLLAWRRRRQVRS